MNMNPGDEYTPEEIEASLRAKVRPMRASPKAQQQSESDRLSIVLNLYYQRYQEPAVGYDVRVERPTASSGQREIVEKLDISMNPTNLPLGKYQGAESLFVLIENRNGHGRRQNPTAQQLNDDESAIIIIERTGDESPLGLVRKGMPYFGELYNPDEITVRSLNGIAKARIVVFPQ